jgi:hypothetical protein
MKLSISSMVRGTPVDRRFKADSVSRNESSRRTPRFLYFCTAGLTFSTKALFSGVCGRFSSAASRM